MSNNNQIDGQLTLDFCLDTDNFVVQSNDFINSIQTLSLNAAKILRAAIMQIKPEDTEFGLYSITASELADLLQVSKSNLYRDMPKLREELMDSKIFIETHETGEAWLSIHLLSYCALSKNKLYIKLNSDLAKYLLGLNKQYTQIVDQEYNLFDSVYAIRLYEIILSRIMLKVIPDEGLFIDIPIEEIKTLTDSHEYENAYNFKKKVLDIAMKNINLHTCYVMSYERLKLNSSKYDTVRFFVNMRYHPKKYLPQTGNM